MTITVNTKSYGLDSMTKDSATYNGPGHSFSAKDVLVLKREAPKPVVNFSGVARTSSKFSRTANLTGALTPTAVNSFEVATNIAVGTSDADIDAYCADMGAYVVSAQFKALLKKLAINQCLTACSPTMD
nr:MAG: hypothetical protein [Sanya solspi-like virus 5]